MRVDGAGHRRRVADGRSPTERGAAGQRNDGGQTAAPDRGGIWEGFVIKSADGAFQLKLRAYVQADGRFFPGDVLAVNYERTEFTAGAAAGNRAPANVLVIRVQQAF